MQISAIIGINNNKLNYGRKQRHYYTNLAPLRQYTVSFAAKMPKDMMELSQEKIISICKKAINSGERLGEGKEAIAYKIEEYPAYCVRREKIYESSGIKFCTKLNKFDIANHVVARLDEGITIMKYIPGVPLKSQNLNNTKVELKRVIQDLLANEFDIKPFKKVISQIENAKSKGIDFDRLGENILVDPMNHEITCIDFSPKIIDNTNEYNPISYIYDALDVDNTQHAPRIFGKLCLAYVQRLLEVPVQKLNLDKLDLHFYHRGFLNDPFNHFPDRELLQETEKQLQIIIREKHQAASKKLPKLVEEFEDFVNHELMPFGNSYGFYGVFY